VSQVIRTSLLVVVLFSASVAAAAPASRDCTGSMIQSSGDAPAPKNLKFVVGPPTTIDLGNGAQPVTAVSNNKIQLKFTTKDFTGEFFHFTGDLFLIYKSGHLARLMCPT
jgi:hypothetical protein